MDSSSQRPRLFLDSNVLTGGIVAEWGLDKAILSLCAARVCRLALAEIVRKEVEVNLLLRAERLGQRAAARLLGDYDQLLRLTRPETVPLPTPQEVAAARSLIRHGADVPVLASAIRSRPDWLLTNNKNHFTKTVAARTGLRIAAPIDYFRALAISISA